MRFFLR